MEILVTNWHKIPVKICARQTTDERLHWDIRAEICDRKGDDDHRRLMYVLKKSFPEKPVIHLTIQKKTTTSVQVTLSGLFLRRIFSLLMPESECRDQMNCKHLELSFFDSELNVFKAIIIGEDCEPIVRQQTGTVWDLCSYEFKWNYKFSKLRLFEDLSVVFVKEYPTKNLFMNTSPCAVDGDWILHNGLYHDFKIISETGRVFKCHKAFLCGASDVIATSLAGNFIEAQRNMLEVKGFSDDALEAFLEYVYCHTFSSALKSSSVCTELLVMADYYNMSELWTDVLSVIRSKPKDWFEPGTLEDVESLLKKTNRETTEALQKTLDQLHNRESSQCKIKVELDKMSFMKLPRGTPSQVLTSENIGWKLITSDERKRKYLQSQLKNKLKSDTITALHFFPIQTTSLEKNIFICGTLLSTIHKVIYDQDVLAKLRISLKLSIRDRLVRDTSYVIVDREEVRGLEPTTVFLGDHPHYCYSGRFDRPEKLQGGRNIPLNLSSEDIFGTAWEYLVDKFENNPRKYRVYAELEIDASNNTLETDEHFRCSISNQKILRNQIYSDCKLVSDSGTVFPCHKEILQASSCVFAHEIAEQQMQNEDTKILVGGVGNSAIMALLDFIYFRSLVAARIDFDIAWELLKLAGQFKLKTLAISLANELFDNMITRNQIDDVIKLVAEAENYLSVDSQSSLSSETALSQVFPNVTGRNLFEDIISYVK